MSKKPTRQTRRKTKDESTNSSSQANVEQLNVQNNYYLNIQPSELVQLEKQNPQLAKEIVEMMKIQQVHSMQIEDRIMTLEETEQEIRNDERPYLRKYVFRGQAFGLIILLSSFALIGVCAYFGSLSGAIVSGISAIVISVSQLIKSKNLKDITKEKK